MRTKTTIGLAGALWMLLSSAGLATTTSTTFQTRITIDASCTIVSAPTFDFGTQAVLASNVNQTGSIQVQCTNSTPYNIGLDAGTGTGATVAVRKMTNGGNTVTYSLYTDSGHSTVWGNTAGTDTVSATGTGASQSFTIYGQVPAQTTPAPALYTDTITLTVSY